MIIVLAISNALLAAAAGLFVWVFMSQLTTPGFAWLQRWLRSGWRRPLISCPWCSGFWLALIFTLLLQWSYLHPVVTPLTVLASAAIIGFAGGFTPGIEDEDDES